MNFNYFSSSPTLTPCEFSTKCKGLRYKLTNYRTSMERILKFKLSMSIFQKPSEN